MSLLHQIALTFIPNIGDIQARALVNHFGNAEDIFKAKRKDLERIEGMGIIRAGEIKKFNAFSRIEKEIKFIGKYNISPIFINDPSYPKRLLNCIDAPVMLYYKGNADLNAEKVIGVVGTRNNTEYGKQLCEKFIEGLAGLDIIIISGLAFGIDTLAHRSAVQNNLKTIGVLAHGLDKLYPSHNKSLAKQMINNGGLLTDFPSDTNPDRQNFPKRNRIVAGICDAVVVIETSIKGGSLITAELANGYNRDVFVFPGRTTDRNSEGCNYLVKSNKACLITSVDDVMKTMNWEDKRLPVNKQKELFVELSDNEKIIVEMLKINDQHIDELNMRSGFPSSTMAAVLLNLELQGVISSMPGKIYRLY